MKLASWTARPDFSHVRPGDLKTLAAAAAVHVDIVRI
jgi:hypothetical protein